MNAEYTKTELAELMARAGELTDQELEAVVGGKQEFKDATNRLVFPNGFTNPLNKKQKSPWVR